MTNQADLKPCQFCSAEGELIHLIYYDLGPYDTGYAMKCGECCVRTDAFDSEEQARQCWNMRNGNDD